MTTGPDGPGSELGTPRHYSEIYEKLVQSDDDDLVGLIAYSLYKQSKREWLVRYEREHRRHPTDGEERIFVSAFTANELKRLREQATNMLSAYAAYVIEQERPGLVEQARQDHLIVLVDERLVEMRAQGRWWRQMVAGVLGAFAYSVLLLILLLIIRLVGVDLVGLVQRASVP
jgi:hypothetical protein